ncbi:sensor histidine kinase [Crassaminicella profunda]|uniref:sensor histidine kinase n=1 Tax=Crassaminicella profunda TaxID=1286698 RepID=UPI001CA68EC3|nr:sensor histidine kinase [Crassaminicella profunda]QZY53840.1 sensor histidine kinase [Crassaminicella profunda]
MKLFFKDQLLLCILYIFNMIFLVGIYQWMGGFENNLYYFYFLTIFFLGCYLIYRYHTHKNFYRRLSKSPSGLEEYLASAGNTPLAQGLDELLKSQYYLYQNQLQNYTRKQKEHLIFMNQWVHQMKTPLSVIQLIIQENEDVLHLENIREEVERLNSGLNMALYMARLDDFQQDFHVDQILLKPLALEVVNELKRLFIRKRVYPEVHIEEGAVVYSDGKWIKFILQQLLTNAIRYSKEDNKKIFIHSHVREQYSVLEVKDEGVGIPKSDIKRVFEAFYTGENGRKFGESTGMGLYLVRKVCEKLDHKIEIESEVEKGTTIRIVFQNGKIT